MLPASHSYLVDVENCSFAKLAPPLSACRRSFSGGTSFSARGRRSEAFRSAFLSLIMSEVIKLSLIINRKTQGPNFKSQIHELLMDYSFSSSFAPRFKVNKVRGSVSQ